MPAPPCFWWGEVGAAGVEVSGTRGSARNCRPIGDGTESARLVFARTLPYNPPAHVQLAGRTPRSDLMSTLTKTAFAFASSFILGVAQSGAQCVAVEDQFTRLEILKVEQAICAKYPQIVSVEIAAGGAQLLMPHAHHQSVIDALLVNKSSEVSRQLEAAVALILEDVGQLLRVSFPSEQWNVIPNVRMRCERTNSAAFGLPYVEGRGPKPESGGKAYASGYYHPKLGLLFTFGPDGEPYVYKRK